MINCVTIYSRAAKPCLRATLAGHLRGSLPVSRPRPIILGGVHHNQRVEHLVAGVLSHPEDVIIFGSGYAALLKLLFYHAGGVDSENVGLSLEEPPKHVVPLSLLRLRGGDLLSSLNHEGHEALSRQIPTGRGRPQNWRPWWHGHRLEVVASVMECCRGWLMRWSMLSVVQEAQF